MSVTTRGQVQVAHVSTYDRGYVARISNQFGVRLFGVRLFGVNLFKVMKEMVNVLACGHES